MTSLELSMQKYLDVCRSNFFHEDKFIILEKVIQQVKINECNISEFAREIENYRKNLTEQQQELEEEHVSNMAFFDTEKSSIKNQIYEQNATEEDLKRIEKSRKQKQLEYEEKNDTLDGQIQIYTSKPCFCFYMHLCFRLQKMMIAMLIISMIPLRLIQSDDYGRVSSASQYIFLPKHSLPLTTNKFQEILQILYPMIQGEVNSVEKLATFLREIERLSELISRLLTLRNERLIEGLEQRSAETLTEVVMKEFSTFLCFDSINEKDNFIPEILDSIRCMTNINNSSEAGVGGTTKHGHVNVQGQVSFFSEMQARVIRTFSRFTRAQKPETIDGEGEDSWIVIDDIDVQELLIQDAEDRQHKQENVIKDFNNGLLVFLKASNRYKVRIDVNDIDKETLDKIKCIENELIDTGKAFNPFLKGGKICELDFSSKNYAQHFFQKTKKVLEEM